VTPKHVPKHDPEAVTPKHRDPEAPKHEAMTPKPDPEASMTALAAELGLTVGRVSQLIKRAEGRG
jgi:hypothetical protein